MRPMPYSAWPVLLHGLARCETLFFESETSEAVIMENASGYRAT